MNVIRRKPNGEFMKQADFKGFIHNGHYFYTTFTVYEDGIIDCWKNCTLEQFKEKIDEGWVCLIPPVGSTVRIDEMDITISDIVMFDLDTKEKMVKKIEYLIDYLNGVDWKILCVEAYNRCVKEMSKEAVDSLRTAYYKVPEGDRRYLLGDMDTKDFEILQILESWKE